MGNEDRRDAPDCPACGAQLSPRASLCPECGADLAVAAARTRHRRLRPGALVVRLLVWGALVALPVVGFLRLGRVGPGPDLATTLRWLALGDGGRAATLVTLHRAHEIAGATARFAVREMAAPDFDGDWASRLAPYSTMQVRGWLPFLFSAADASLAPAGARAFYQVRAADGWGRAYRVRTRTLARGQPWPTDPQVAADLAAGLKASFFAVGRPDFAAASWLRLELDSAGPDGTFDDGDDLAFVSYVPLEHTLRLSNNREQVQRELDRVFVRGRQLYRIEGSRWDLVDARLLAEFRTPG